MARISNYERDAEITVNDKLLGSSYEGEGISGPIYETKNFKISNLASFLNLIFTVDEVNYNLHEWSDYLDESYTINLDSNGNIANLERLAYTDLTEFRFDVGTFKLWNSTEDASAVPFEMRSGLVKLKKSFYDVSFNDIPDVPPTFILTTVYADDYQGSNQSLTRGDRNYYGIYQGSARLTESDLPVTGVDWNQITGDAAIAIKLDASKYVINYDTSNDETDTISFTTTTQNVGGAVDPGYIFYVDGVEKQAKSSTSTFTLADADEPSFGESVTVKVELYNGEVLIAQDSVGIYGIKDGTDAITAFLTNPSHVVVADNDGDVVNTNFPNAGGTFKVYVGGDDVTTSCTFGVASETGVDVSIVQDTGVYSVSSMSADEGTADFEVTIPAATARTVSDVTRTATYSIAKSIKGDTGLTGNPGSNSKSVHLKVAPNVVQYDEFGARITSSMQLTADPQGYSTPEYRFLKDGIELTQITGSGRTTEWTTGNTYTVPAALMVPALQTDDWTVEVRESSSDTNPSSDVQTVYGTQDSTNAITVVLENDTTVLPTSAAGNVNYNYSNNKIKVYKGNDALTYIQSPSPSLSSGEFTVTVTGTDITPSTSISGNNTTEFIIGNASNMVDSNNNPVDNASIEFEVEIYGGVTNITVTKTQTFAKAKQGEIGQSITGPQGQRIITGVIWYDEGSSTTPSTPTAVDSNGDAIVYDFDNQVFDSAPPLGWQEDAPNAEPGTADSIYWTSRFKVEEGLTNGVPNGEGTPTFEAPVRALVFNQVVVFQSDEPNHGYTQIDGGYIKTVNIRSLNYDAPDSGETFADDGMLIDLQNSKIISKYLVLDSNGLEISGSGTFTGSLTGASGNFGGVNISSGGVAATGFSLTSSGLTVTGATIGGWTIDSNSIHAGTKDTSGYTTGGITFFNNGTFSSIHSKNFYIDGNGDAFFKGDITGANIGDNIGLDDGDIVLERFVTDDTAAQTYGNTTGGKITFKDVSTTLYGLRRYYDGTFGDSFDDYAIIDGNQRVNGTLNVDGLIKQTLASAGTWGNVGYTKLASDKGGLIIQWVTKVNTVTSSPYVMTAAWPTDFPNKCLGAVATRVTSSGGSSTGTPSTPPNNNNAVNLSYTKNNYSVDFNDSGTIVFIIAIGY